MWTGTAKELAFVIKGLDPDKEYSLTEYRPTRSKNQNSYFHKLVDLMATAHTLTIGAITATAMKNTLIGRYGQKMRDLDGEPLIIKTNTKSESRHYLRKSCTPCTSRSWRMNKRTKATAIPIAVKAKVYDRDGGCCIFCGRPGAPNAHYIARSHGGKGIEQNIITACSECHHEMDNGKTTERYKTYAQLYLKGKYEDWDEKELVYSK